MKKICIILTMICYAYDCCSQVADDFTDENYTINPTWIPDEANNWTVVNGQLRSNSAQASSSFFISTPSTRALDTQWEIYLLLQFNTSGANYVDIYLSSDQENLLSPDNNGYFVRIGGTPDEISLYKLTSGTPTLLINGEDGVTNRSNNPVRIKVTRNEHNDWLLQRDANGGTTYVTEGETKDNTYSSGNFFGIRIQQSTSGFFNRHFFDDIYVGDIRAEQDPPKLESIAVLSDKQLLLHFNESLEISSAQTASNYHVANVGYPADAQLQSDGVSVLLDFPTSFGNGITHTIDVSGVQDLAGNEIEPVSMPFIYFKANPVQEKDIIITEIFADPAPQVGLPETEYIEIFNRSGNPVDVNGWQLSDGSSTASFPSRIILPGQHWVVCSTSGAPAFPATTNIVGLSNFPTLNNNGDALTLTTNDGQLVDAVNYSIAWYRDEDKQEGGWSLELIDPNNPCGEEANWIACEDALGGTPGKINSVNASKPDLTGPRLLSVSVISSHEIVLGFDEKLEKSITAPSVLFSPKLDVAAWSYTSVTLRGIKLTLLQDLSLQQLYTIEVADLRDCNGNPIQQEFDQLSFALPEAAETGDVLINEILFNPRPGGVDFVEIINVSSKYINLKNWSLANYDDETPGNQKPITASDYLLYPGQMLALTGNESILKIHYPAAQDGNHLSTLLPPLNDDAGSVALLAPENLLLDHVEYTESHHAALLKDKESVSLERVSVTSPAVNPDNWKSASSSAGFATPGKVNSNSRSETQLDENSVSVNPEIFSPAVPGQDFTQINYSFDQTALAANVKIVDHQGRVIKEIANNETLGAEGFFRWDGDRDDGSKARMGYYFVWFETFGLNGMVKTYQKRVVIGR